MEDHQVSPMVHEAIARARKAAKSSPRPRPRSLRSPFKSPSTRDGGASHFTFDKKSTVAQDRTSASRWKQTSEMRNDNDDDLSAHSSTDMDRLLAPSESSDDDDDDDDDDHSNLQLSLDNSTDDEHDCLMAPTFSSVNSSEAIIKRVEEEIANARKAAQDSNRRLAGWDSSSKYPNSATVYDDIEESSSIDGPTSPGDDLLDHDAIQAMLNFSTDEHENVAANESFASAKEEIGDVEELEQATNKESESNVISDELARDIGAEPEPSPSSAEPEVIKDESVKSFATEPSPSLTQDFDDATPSTTLPAEEDKNGEESSERNDDTDVEGEIEVALWTSKDESVMIETTVSFSGRQDQHSEISIKRRIDENIEEKISDEENNDDESDDELDIENIGSDVAIKGEKPTHFALGVEKTSCEEEHNENNGCDQKNGNDKQVEKEKSEDSQIPAAQEVEKSKEPKVQLSKLVERGEKVTFRRRYPVPPIQTRSRDVADIIKDNSIAAPEVSMILTKPSTDVQKLFAGIFGQGAARRSNACGTLKVMASQTKNRWSLLHTEGFLDALIHVVASDVSDDDFEAEIDARERALSCILHVAEHKDNRPIVLLHKGLPESLVKCISENRGESGAMACGVLATLAKTPACRGPMIRVQDLIKTLSLVLKGEAFPAVEEYSDADVEDESSGESDDETSFDGTLDQIEPSYSSSSTEHSVSDHGSFSDQESFASSYDDEGSEIEETMRTRNHIRRSQTDESQAKREALEKRARAYACAALLHISKDCTAAEYLSRNLNFIGSVLAVAGDFENPLHEKCLEIICNLTKFPTNHGIMVKFPGLVDALISGGKAQSSMARLWSLRSLQNLSSQSSGKNVLANRAMLEFLSSSAIKSDPSEQYAAMATLYNLSTEPGAVVPLTNTKNVIAMLVHAAHSPDTAAEIRSMACSSLATLGLWMQTLAGAGSVPKIIPPVPLPSHVTTGWRRWD